MHALCIPVADLVFRFACMTMVPATLVAVGCSITVCKYAAAEQDRRRNDDHRDRDGGRRPPEQPRRISLRLETRPCKGTSLEPASRCRRHEFGFHCFLPLGRCVYASIAQDTAWAARRLAAPHPLTLRGAGSNLVVLTSPSSAAALEKGCCRQHRCRKRQRGHGARPRGGRGANRTVGGVARQPPQASPNLIARMSCSSWMRGMRHLPNAGRT